MKHAADGMVWVGDAGSQMYLNFQVCVNATVNIGVSGGSWGG